MFEYQKKDKRKKKKRRKYIYRNESPMVMLQMAPVANGLKSAVAILRMLMVISSRTEHCPEVLRPLFDHIKKRPELCSIPGGYFLEILFRMFYELKHPSNDVIKHYLNFLHVNVQDFAHRWSAEVVQLCGPMSSLPMRVADSKVRIKGNDILACNYGFTLTNNPHDQVPLGFSKSVIDQYQFELLKQLNIADFLRRTENGGYIINLVFRGCDPFPAAGIMAARILMNDSEKLKEWWENDKHEFVKVQKNKIKRRRHKIHKTTNPTTALHLIF